MSFLEKQFANLPFEDIGKWIEYDANEDGTIPRIKIRRAHPRHREYASVFTELVRQNKGKVPEGDKEEDDKLMIECYARTIVLAWEHIICPADLAEKFGITAGDRIPFSVNNVRTLFHSRKRFYDDIFIKANRESTFMAQQDEDSAKN